MHTLTLPKGLAILSLGLTSVFAVELVPSDIERYVTFGVGGVLALTIFYFYRQLAASSIERESACAKEAREQLTLMVGVVQENSKVNERLHNTVESLQTTLTHMNDEQRHRYEQELRNATTSANAVSAAASAALSVVEHAKADAIEVVNAAAAAAKQVLVQEVKK